MVRHIVMFSYREGFSQEENRRNAERIRKDFIALKNIIPGIVEFEVIIDPLPTSNRDLVLNTLFASEEALAMYQTHPEHIRVGDFVAATMCNRTCIDYVE